MECTVLTSGAPIVILSWANLGGSLMSNTSTVIRRYDCVKRMRDCKYQLYNH